MEINPNNHPDKK